MRIFDAKISTGNDISQQCQHTLLLLQRGDTPILITRHDMVYGSISFGLKHTKPKDTICLCH